MEHHTGPHRRRRQYRRRMHAAEFLLGVVLLSGVVVAVYGSQIAWHLQDAPAARLTIVRGSDASGGYAAALAWAARHEHLEVARTKRVPERVRGEGLYLLGAGPGGYTEAGLASARAHMESGGWVAAEPSAFGGFEAVAQRRGLAELLGVRAPVWFGGYAERLESQQQLAREWEASTGEQWRFTGPGMWLRNAETIVVLEGAGMPRVRLTSAAAERWDAAPRQHRWDGTFALAGARPGATVEATLETKLSTASEELLRGAKISLPPWPVVIAANDGRSTFLGLDTPASAPDAPLERRGAADRAGRRAAHRGDHAAAFTLVAWRRAVLAELEAASS